MFFCFSCLEGFGCLLVHLASNNNNSAGFLVHALEQQEREQPVSEVVGRKGDVEPVTRPRLLAKVEHASVEDEGADGRDLAGRHAALWNSPRR